MTLLQLHKSITHGLCLLAGLLLCAPVAGQSSTPADASDGISLISGLVYKRLQTLPSASAKIPTGAAVIDLRGTRIASPESVTTIGNWVNSSAHLPLRLVLIDSTTAAEIVQGLEGRHRYLITLGAASPAISPDVAVATPLRADEQARDALDAGTSPQELLPSKLDKRRYDEAAMVRDHANGVPLPDSPPDLSDPEEKDAIAPPAPSTDKASPPQSSPPTPVQDAVLQRAIQLYEALVALKHIRET